MSNVTELQRSVMQSLFDAYGDDEIAVCDAYAEAERAGNVARPEEDRGQFAESYARSLWRVGKAEGWLWIMIAPRTKWVISKKNTSAHVLDEGGI